ncbi:MAG: adenine phosphoribosyltransferase [Marinifilaceae bacterium]|jgi:adenine phosphoribosyltransferase|nr:adenine phosphoribosyltransferase [Marinifilaceae bacterium]
MTKELLEAKESIRDIVDWPKPGILFKDITTLLKDNNHLATVVDAIYDKYKDSGITKVVGLESRGFILGSVLAYRLNVGFVPIRKPGKLPAEIYSQSYDLEYGTDTVNIHRDALSEDDVVLMHDDLLATGGTAAASISLIKKSGVKKIYADFMVELEFLKGREKLDKDVEIESLFLF